MFEQLNFINSIEWYFNMSVNNELRITQRHAHVEWKIEKFCDQPKMQDYLVESPLFHFYNSQWSIQVYPNGETCNNSEGCIALYLHKEESAEECCVACKIGIKKNNGSELCNQNFKFTYEMKSYGYGYPRFLQSSFLESSKDFLAPDGSLTVFCTVRVENTKDEQSQTTSTYDIPTLAEDLKSLYIDRQYADITFKIKNEELVANKCILAARSKVFAAMFQHDMAEKNSGIVEVDDSNLESFEDFILYLYTGKLDVVSSSNALSLYQTADKYDVVQLKKECARIMERELCLESLCDVIRIATMHGESDLLTAATDFFSKNLVTILKTPKWQVFLAENPTFGNELFLKAVDKSENK